MTHGKVSANGIEICEQDHCYPGIDFGKLFRKALQNSWQTNNDTGVSGKPE